ncbi:XRE family transcriptional regulator, partial [Clostridiaceae bacterium]|nr:XRE family transcriptional regulator [Clostridiaceae bacterium]
ANPDLPKRFHLWWCQVCRTWEFSLKVEHIDRICEVLDCSVEELIEYIPDKVPKTGKHLVIEEHGNRKTGKGQ